MTSDLSGDAEEAGEREEAPPGEGRRGVHAAAAAAALSAPLPPPGKLSPPLMPKLSCTRP